MRFFILVVALVSTIGLTGCIGMSPVKSAGPMSSGPVRTVTAESGVVPPGSSLTIRTKDTVSTQKAFRGTIYDASVAEDILDQYGNVLIAKESRVELVVRSFGSLGPGGAGELELKLGIRNVVVKGICYPVQTGEIRTVSHQADDTGGREGYKVVTKGRRINVPAETFLMFEIEDPIRLIGYRH